MNDRDNPSVEFDALRKRVARLEVLVKGILDEREAEQKYLEEGMRLMQEEDERNQS
jgi:hypothetical protein